MKKSRTAGPSRVVESPTVRSLPLVEVLVDTKAALFELMMQSGLQVLDALLEEDVVELGGGHQRELWRQRPIEQLADSIPVGLARVQPCGDLLFPRRHLADPQPDDRAIRRLGQGVRKALCQPIESGPAHGIVRDRRVLLR